MSDAKILNCEPYQKRDVTFAQQNPFVGGCIFAKWFTLWSFFMSELFCRPFAQKPNICERISQIARTDFEIGLPCAAKHGLCLMR